MRARLLLEVEANEVDPRRPEATQVADLEKLILNRLGAGEAVHGGAPALRDVRVIQTIVISSARHSTPMEGAVAAAAEDVTRKIVLDDLDEPKKPG